MFLYYRVTEREFEEVVRAHYADLYRFALSLARQESEACDLTQETFYIWASKHAQVREPGKLRSWLFRTLHREFLGRRRREKRFPHFEIASIEHELPEVTPAMVERLDAERVMEALLQLDEMFRYPLILFYFEDYSYNQIAEALSLPTGTVMSRLSRGKVMLRRLLLDGASESPAPVAPFIGSGGKGEHE